MQRNYFFLLFVFFLACTQPVIFENTRFFEHLIWNRFDFVEYDFEINNTNELVDLKVSFMHTASFATDYIVMNISLYDPDGGFRSRDYEFRLQDENMQWLGKEANNIYSLDFDVLKNQQFSQPGTYHIRIENKMTKFNLTNVVGIGFLVQQSKNH